MAPALTDSSFTTTCSHSIATFQSSFRKSLDGQDDSANVRLHCKVPGTHGQLRREPAESPWYRHEAAKGLIDCVTPVYLVTLHSQCRGQLYIFNGIMKHFDLGRREFPYTSS
ncbi:hypothetical protein MRX96_048185 [Rhipicephalus microplus]